MDILIGLGIHGQTWVDQRSDLQSVSADLGYNAGASDGIIGPDTVRAVMQAQTGLGIEADGYPDLELLARLKTLKD